MQSDCLLDKLFKLLICSDAEILGAWFELFRWLRDGFSGFICVLVLGQAYEAIFYISGALIFGGIKFFWTIEDAGTFLGGGKFMPESLF